MKKTVMRTSSSEVEIFIGEGFAKELIKTYGGGQANFVVTDERVYELYREFFSTCFSAMPVCKL